MTEKFWLVWNESMGGKSTVKHPTRESAEREAERLARNHRGWKFAVMENIAVVSVTDVHWERDENHYAPDFPPVPF
jgi:hypothetical protein